MNAPEQFGQRATQQAFKLRQIASQAIGVRDQLDLVFQTDPVKLKFSPCLPLASGRRRATCAPNNL